MLISDHQHIEDEEDERERKFEGLPSDADLSSDHPAQDPLDEHAHAPGEGPAGDGQGQAVFDADGKASRASPGAAPNRIREEEANGKVDLREAAEKVKGKVRSGHHAPRSPEERLKAGVPYSEHHPRSVSYATQADTSRI